MSFRPSPVTAKKQERNVFPFQFPRDKFPFPHDKTQFARSNMAFNTDYAIVYNGHSNHFLVRLNKDLSLFF